MVRLLKSGRKIMKDLFVLGQTGIKILESLLVLSQVSFLKKYAFLGLLSYAWCKVKITFKSLEIWSVNHSVEIWGIKEVTPWKFYAQETPERRCPKTTHDIASRISLKIALGRNELKTYNFWVAIIKFSEVEGGIANFWIREFVRAEAWKRIVSDMKIRRKALFIYRFQLIMTSFTISFQLRTRSKIGSQWSQSKFSKLGDQETNNTVYIRLVDQTLLINLVSFIGTTIHIPIWVIKSAVAIMAYNILDEPYLKAQKPRTAKGYDRAKVTKFHENEGEKKSSTAGFPELRTKNTNR